jgi:hypothetical protein
MHKKIRWKIEGKRDEQTDTKKRMKDSSGFFLLRIRRE